MPDIYDTLLDQQQAQPAAPAAPAIDIYDQILDGERLAAQRAMQPVLDMATKIQPERAASAQGLAKSTGLPVEIVERNFEEVQRREQIRNMQDILGRSPVLARQMADPDFARLAHEDIEQLGALERITQGLKESGSSLVAGLYSGSAGVVGYAEAAAGLASRFTKPLAGTVLPADLGGLVQDSARDYRQSIQAYAKGWRPESSGILGKGWHAGLESFARNLPGIPLMLMPGGANAALLGMTLPVAGEEFGAARDKGLGLLESMIYGASQGALEYGTEKIPMSKLLGDLSKGSGFLKTLRRQVYAESWTEQVATLTQDLNQWAAIEINEGKTFGDYLAERPEAAAITAIATLVGTTGQTTIVHGMQKTLERVYGEAARAQLDVDIIERLAEAQRIVQSLQLTQINPASLEEYLQSLTEDSDISDLYIDASAIVDAGLVDQLSAVSPSVAEQIEQAVELGQQVRIPVEELLAQVAPSGVADALVDHLRTSPDGKTRAEAEEYLQRVSEEYRQQSAGVIQASAEQLAFDAELTAYGDQLVEQLDAIGGVHRHDHNVALASVHKGLVGALAQRAGMSPSDFIARYGVLRVSNEEEARSEDGTRATLEYLEKAYLDSHVDYERALSEGGDVDAAAAVRDAAKARLDAVRSGGIGSWQPPAELRPELAAMHLARRELDAARRAFDDASQAGAAELPIEAIRESSIKMAQAIDAAFGGELSIVADQFGGGKIELVRARDGTGWVVELRNEAGEVERDAVFTDRVSAIEAFLGDAVLAGMSFTYADSTGSQAAPAVSPIVAAREAAEAVAAELAAFDAAIDQGQEVDLGAQWDALDRQTEALRALQAELEALPDDGFALEAATPGGLVMSLTASAQQPGKWQLTRFDQAGEPWGDTQYETKGEAILEFLSDADVSTVRDFGGQLNQRDRPFGGEEIARSPIGDVTEIDVDGEMRPALNSAGRPIHPTIEGVRNFWRWFGDSQVVDAQGRPVVLYHASAREFDQSNRTFWGFANQNGANAYAAMRAEAGNAAFVMPVYLSSSRTFDADALDTASSFDYPDGLSVGRFIDQLIGQSGASGAVRDRLQEIARELKKHAKTQESGPTYSPENFWYTQHFYFGFEGQKLIEEAFRLAGFDGLKFTEQVNWFDGDAYQSSGELSFAAFSPNQIKSATGNRGAFDPNEPNILYQRGSGRGSYLPSLNLVRLNNANLSTFIHETGHYGLEMLIAVASDISAKSADQITGSERGTLRDVNALMQWFGVRDINEWSMMSLEEKRGHHEQFAESFERYVMEGRAPSVELGGAFATMRRMMFSVYQTIKNMITSNPDAGALSDEVRQVFDRMIATDEQIEMQARVRSMLPLFESMDQANAIGATIEDWDQYQRDAEGAVDQAKAELAAAGVRDMKWLDGARSRALKKLQQHVASLREEAEMQARREVMTQPVYRAWQFLTGKVGEESQLPKPPKRKSDPNAVDPSIDSLFVAIAKLGGIDRAELESEWGLDPKERIAQAGFGKHVLRRNGGRGIDEMRTLLVQYGYLDPNEADPNEADPNWNPREFEERFFEELGGSLHYSSSADYAYLESLDMLPGQQALSPDQITAGRLDLDGLAAIGIPAEIVEHLKNLRMTARAGWHPDVLVETFDFGFDSGDALVRTIAAAPSLDDAIRARTDEIMLDRHSDLATPEGLKSAADEAVLSDLRAKVVASQLKALTRATGSELDLRRAARSVAAEIVARLKVRNVRPSIYSAAEARASKASAAALAKDDIETAAREQRNQLLSLYSAKEAYAALRDVDSAVKYLARFEGDAARKSISQDYLDQILEITSRFDLRKGVSLKEIDRVTSLQEWIEAQRDEGIEPDIPEWLKSGAKRTHYKNLTVAELRDVVDTIKHIEHLGRLKNRLLTARDNRTLAQVVSEIAASMEVASGGRVIDNQRRNELSSIITHGARGFMAMHRQLHSLVREMDGFADFGPFWQALVMPMNAAGDLEASMRADAAKRLHELAKPVLAEAGKMGGKGQLVPSLGRSLNRGERIAILLNWGNEGNTQRLLDGYGWRDEQLEPILNSFSRAELDFAQGVWDFFESYRPQIAAKERRVNGKEPEWIEPRSFTVQTKEGDTVTLRGGYYPVKYDVNQSGEAARNADADFADMARRAARVSSTTRRGYTKNRAEKVVGRPIVLSFDGIYSGANEVIHDLAWHEWLIDAGRLLRKLDPVIRNRYGAEYVTEITKLLGDIAQGDTPATNAFESTIQHLRNGATIAGLGWNLTTSLLQFTGFSNSVVRLGGVVDGSVWLARGLREFYGSPGHMMRKIEEAQGKSEFLRNRAMTMNRDINDIVNRLDKGKSDIRLKIEASFFVLIQKAQMMVDYPTWYAAYEKAMADPATVREDGTTDEALAISFADQMVVSAQAGGTTKDLARMQRGGPLLKLFTNFYSYFAATLQIAIERTKATDFRKPSNVAMLAGDYLLLMVIPAMLGMIIRAFMKGEDLDDDEWIDRIAAEQIGFIMGMTPITREMTLAVQALGGVGGRFDYAGPAGLRFFAELQKLGVQVSQGEFDMAAFKAANNTAGVLFHYPAGQVNRTVEGTAALLEGRTGNPLAVIAGPPPRN